MKKLINILFAFVVLLSCSKKEGKIIDPTVPPIQGGTGVLKVDSFTPNSGPKGTIVTIEGTGFSTKASENLVTFNGIPATVISASATTLKIAISQIAFGKITVKTGNSSVTSVDEFLYTYTSSTMAGNGFPGFSDGDSETAQFRDAFGLAIDIAGNVYVADSENNRIRKITPQGIVSTVAGGEYGFADGIGTAAKFRYPHGIALDLKGNLYVADSENNRIRKITPNGIVSTLAGSGEIGFVDGIGSLAKFNFPMDVVVDDNGNVFFTDSGNDCIRKITPTGEVTTIGDDVFGVPEGIDIDASGNLYVADTGTSRIFKMTQAGVSSVIAGTGFGHLDGPVATAQFKNPEGIALDYAGNIYVGDLHNHVIRKISPKGIVSTISGSSKGFVEGNGLTVKFNEPSGIDVDILGNLYIADSRNSRIRKLQ